jgi:hypothetical protein
MFTLTAAVLAAGAIAATHGTAHAVNIGGGCVGVVNGEVVRVNCETGKPISDKEYNRQLNNGWDVYEARQSDNAVFEVPLPKRVRGGAVTVTATYTGASPLWLYDVGAKFDEDVVRTKSVKVTGTGITVAIPNTDFDKCYSVYVTVKPASGKAYKYRIVGYGKSWNYGPNPDNGYRDLTIAP